MKSLAQWIEFYSWKQIGDDDEIAESHLNAFRGNRQFESTIKYKNKGKNGWKSFFDFDLFYECGKLNDERWPLIVWHLMIKMP